MAETTKLSPQSLADRIPLGRDPAAVRKRVESLEAVLERMFFVPGLNRSIGLDVVLDLIPVGGSTIGAILGGYMLWEARNLKMRRADMVRMAGNVGIDWLLGLIPWIGAVPDYFFRSNTRNLKIIMAHLDRHHPATATLSAGPARS